MAAPESRTEKQTNGSAPAAPASGAGDPKLIIQLIETIQADLDRLRGLVEPQLGEFVPGDPRNKTCDGKLTDKGVECCYRMFDEGKSRYSVAREMKISFAAATHRFSAWLRAGGKERDRNTIRLG